MISIAEHKPATISRRREKQTRYLSQAIQLEESVNPHIIRDTMSMVSLAILAFLVWAGLTRVDEVARTSGEVVPHGYQQIVQHLEGGMIASIHVQEGEVVEEGQILVTLNDNGIREDLERERSKQVSLEMQAERLRAFVEGRAPDFSGFRGVTEQMLEDQKSFFEGMSTARAKEAEIIRSQITEKRQAVESLRHDLETARKNHSITGEMFKRREELNARGYYSDLQLLENKKQLNDLQANITRLENQLRMAATGIGEFEERLASLSARHHDEAYELLSQVVTEKSQNIEIIRKLEERMERLNVRAPVRGLVKGLAINTVGAVVQPGQTLMEIVPLDRTLEVQVRIMPQDIGHVSVGQPVQVKFSTYDFAQYGSVSGRLEHISATTFSGEKGERYYQGRIVLGSDHVGHNKGNLILPGMTVMADIITGDKTILQYLLKPIQRSLKTAFTER